MKQRIIKRTYKSGNIYYVIQVRFMWLWSDLDTSAHLNSFATLEEAKSHLWFREDVKEEVVFK